MKKVFKQIKERKCLKCIKKPYKRRKHTQRKKENTHTHTHPHTHTHTHTKEKKKYKRQRKIKTYNDEKEQGFYF